MNSYHTTEDPLARVRGQLEAEYGGMVPRERIDRAAKQEALSDARIRDFVPLLAWRQARAQLRSGAREASRGSSPSGSAPCHDSSAQRVAGTTSGRWKRTTSKTEG
jgi:hypothetical protein